MSIHPAVSKHPPEVAFVVGQLSAIQHQLENPSENPFRFNGDTDLNIEELKTSEGLFFKFDFHAFKKSLPLKNTKDLHRWMALMEDVGILKTGIVGGDKYVRVDWKRVNQLYYSR